jgi:hypothetical protein
MRRRSKAKFQKQGNSDLRKAGLWKVSCRVLAVLLLSLLALLGGVRWFGLPRGVAERVQRELQAHGLHVRADRLYLDFFGRVRARHIYITKTGGEAQYLGDPGSRFEGSVTVGKALVRFNWLSWWRGEPFLRGASISRAEVTCRLDKNTSVRVEDVSAEVMLYPNSVEVSYLRGRWYNLKFDLAGALDLTGLEAAPAGRPLDLDRLAASYRGIEETIAQWTAREPLVLSGRFKVPLADVSASESQFQLRGADQWWKGVKVARVDLDADYAARSCRLKGVLTLMRGQFTVGGQWDSRTRRADVNFYSEVDLSRLAGAVPEGAARALAALRFEQLPVNQGTLHLDWEQGFGFVLRAKSAWRDFFIGGQKFDSFASSFSYDGRRVMVTGFDLRGPAGTVAAELFYDGERKVQGRADCAVDPRAFRALFGEGAQPFFDSLDFKSPPVINATLGLSDGGLAVGGRVSAADFAYKGVRVLRASSEFDFRNHELHLVKLHLKRAEGEGSGEIWDNFKTRQVRVKGVRGTLNVQDVALILGNKMAEYMRPYQFVDTPTFFIDGLFDLDDGAAEPRTDMKARLVSNQGAHYVFMQRKLLLSGVDLNIAVRGRKMALTANRPLAVFGGQLDGVLNVLLVEKTGYDTQLRFTDNDFAAVMKTFFNNGKVTGRLEGNLNLRGEFDDMRSMKGDGVLKVHNGELYNIPFLGGLSELLNAVIPDMGYAKASDAESKLAVGEGVIKIQQLGIKSMFFVLIGEGSYDFINDKMDLNVRANVKGLPGLLLFPVSKMFEYHGTGPITGTKWGARNF